jgi:hypothetical protein
MTDPAPASAVPVALALLNHRWPVNPAADSAAPSAVLAALENDPRYLIGRLQQALSVLLAADLPPMDPLTSLVSRAIGDAIAWREHHGRPCADCNDTDDTPCPPCAADYDLADSYHALSRALGVLDNLPVVSRPDPPPAATAAASCQRGRRTKRT